VILAKEEKVLQDINDNLVENGTFYGTEMNVKKTKVMRISRQPFPVKIMIDQKQLKNVESLNTWVAF
jgi:predicted Zn-dependent protease